MTEFRCVQCGNIFLRAKSQVRDPNNTCCGLACRNEKFKTTLKGSNNPNYRHSDASNPECLVCVCGTPKDYRASLCAKCSNSGFPKGRKYGGARITTTDSPTVITPPLSSRDVFLKEITAGTPDMAYVSAVVSQSKHYKDAAEKLGCKRSAIREFITEHQLPTAHFIPGRRRPGDSAKFLVDGPKRVNGTIKSILLREALIPYECAFCGQGNHWNGNTLTLQLDHINGNSADNRVENLRFLCPNCHTQTDTYCGRSSRGAKKPRHKKDD